MKLKIFLPALLVVLAPASGRAGGTAGAQPFDFLFLDANARSVAMGGAYTALASDSNAMIYNPAGLARVPRHEVTFMHNQYVQGLTHDYAGLALKQGVGFNLNYLRFGDLNRTTYSSPDGTLGRFAIDDLALGAGYGRTFFEGVSFGGAVKYIREKNDGVAAAGYAMDAGTLVSILAVPKLTAGLAVQNMGTSVRFLNDKEPLPLNLRGGLAYARDDGMTFAFDVLKERNDKIRFAVGAEALLAKALAVRAGFNSRNDAGIGISAGVGWNWRDLSLDYAFAPYGDLGIAHRVSATFRWGKRAESSEKDDTSRRPEPERDAPEHRSPAEWEAAGGAVAEETADSRFAEARRLIARHAYAEAEVELALAQKLIQSEDRQLVQYFERMGFIALQQREIARAKSLYLEGLKLASSLGFSGSHVADAYEGLGRCLAAQGDDANALRAFKKAYGVEPSSATRRLVEETERNLEKRRGP
ncbi:MAG TPA: hypothetical protein DCZ01_08190 [Elusimicrobia bacterium]|nr:MAG: hypothetical protein A2X37_02780 [Elusimicrobia bacterium GWA2_66_18]HAZ08481.1 hypothetical protein [Elusimicrobiota bacterium]